jgi:CCR4-NOT transcriptional regulation complex NOT5 subunit
MKKRNDDSKTYLADVASKNVRMAEDIEKRAHEIEQKRQDHHMLFKVALETIMKRLKDYEADCLKKGIPIE